MMSTHDITTVAAYAKRHPGATKRLAKLWARKHPTQAARFKRAVVAFTKSFSTFVARRVRSRTTHHGKTR